MQNAFFVCCYWKQGPHGDASWVRLFRHSQFKSFPSKDCYSKRAWDWVLKLARLIYYELLRSSITQRTSRSDYLDFNNSDWEYFKYRLLEANEEVEVVSKIGVTTLPYSRLKGTIKEVIKSRLTKVMIPLDTISLFASLQRVLGYSIIAGLQMPTPAAPMLKTRENTAFTVMRGTTNDSFNLFHTLPSSVLMGQVPTSNQSIVESTLPSTH
jgi:hypothetical protein